MKLIYFCCFIALAGCSSLNKSELSLTRIKNEQLKSIVFFDNFSDNSKKWKLLKRGEFLLDISDGVLHLNKTHSNSENNGCMWYSKQIDNFNSANDFVVSFDAKINSTDDIDNAGFDFQWGDLNNELYQVYISIKGDVSIKYFKKDKGWSETIVSSFYINPVIENNAWGRGCVVSGRCNDFSQTTKNHFDIFQIGNNCLVFINNKKVVDVEIEKINGSKIGFQQCLKVDWELDNLEIRQN